MDKVDAYDKEQLQAMGWLFDEIETPDGGVVLKGVFIANVPIAKGDLVICQADTLDAIKVVFGASYNYYRSAFAVAQSDAEAGQAVDVRLNGGTLDVTGMPGTGNVLYVRAITPADPTQEMLSLTISSVSFDAPTFSKDIAIALGVRMDATTVSLFSEPQYFYLAYNEAANKQEMVSFANPINVEAVGRLLGQSTAFSQKLAAYSPFWEALTSNESFVRSLGGESAFGESLAANATFANALAAFTTFQNSLAGKPSFGTKLGANTYLGAVRYLAQSLTPAQQTQARKNIGVSVPYVLPYSALANSLTQEQADALLVSEALVITDVPNEMNGTNGPTLFIRGAYENSYQLVFVNTTYTPEGNIAFRTIVLDYKENWIGGITDGKVNDLDALHTNSYQSIPVTQQNYAFKNIGLDYVVIPIAGTRTTLTQAQETAMLNAKGVIFLGSLPYEPATRRVYVAGQTDGNTVFLYALLSGNKYLLARYLKSTKQLTLDGTGYDLAPEAVRFSVQNLTEAQQTQVLDNLGLDFVSLPSTVFDTPLTDTQDAQVKAARAVIIDGQRFVYHYTSVYEIYTYFYAFNDVSSVYVLRYNASTKTFVAPTRSLITDLGALRFDKAQSLTPAQQAQARQNIGITQGLLNDADFIAELKTKLGLT